MFTQKGFSFYVPQPAEQTAASSNLDSHEPASAAIEPQSQEIHNENDTKSTLQVENDGSISADFTKTQADDGSDSPQDAFNPETGEINWDCPCIAPMIQPPCGNDFKAAFSCFVYSKTEPKGIDCVDLFKEMQQCFQKHPEIYGSDEEEEEENSVQENKVESGSELDGLQKAE